MMARQGRRVECRHILGRASAFVLCLAVFVAAAGGVADKEEKLLGRVEAFEKEEANIETLEAKSNGIPIIPPGVPPLPVASSQPETEAAVGANQTPATLSQLPEATPSPAVTSQAADSTAVTSQAADSTASDSQPLRVYLVPVNGKLIFRVLQEEWDQKKNLSLDVTHGVPCSWLFPQPTDKPDPKNPNITYVQPCTCKTGESSHPNDTGRVLQSHDTLCNDAWGDQDQVAVIPEYGGGFRHKETRTAAADYWLTVSLLSGVSPDIMRRVQSPGEADIFFLPIFSSLFYMEPTFMKRRFQFYSLAVAALTEFLRDLCIKASESTGSSNDEESSKEGSNEEESSGGSTGGRIRSWCGNKEASSYMNASVDQFPDALLRRVVIPAAHPWAMDYFWTELAQTRMLKLDFCFAVLRETLEPVANVEKDVVMPYESLMPPYLKDNGPWSSSRKTLLFFRGRLKRTTGGEVRTELAAVLANQSGIEVTNAFGDSHGYSLAENKMRTSKFCLMPQGSTASSARFFDAIMNHCIPVVVSDSYEPPFEDELDYTEFAVFIPRKVAVIKGFLVNFLRNLPESDGIAMWNRLKEVKWKFVFGTPARKGGPEELIWKAIHRKVSRVPKNFKSYREKRMKIMVDLLVSNGLKASDFVPCPPDPAFKRKRKV